MTSRWIDVKQPYPTPRECDYMDMEDIEAAQAIVQITGDKDSHGGRHSEHGIGIARGQLLVLIGPREQVFHYLDEVVVTGNADEALAALRSYQVALRRMP